MAVFTFCRLPVNHYTSHNRLISPCSGLLFLGCLKQAFKLLSNVSKCPRSLVNPLLLLYWIGGGCSRALTGILECVRLSAGLCLDKAACPLSLMPQLGRGMPPRSWNRKTAEGCHAYWGKGWPCRPGPLTQTTTEHNERRGIVWSQRLIAKASNPQMAR